jgi:hypothetical protein
MRGRARKALVAVAAASLVAVPILTGAGSASAIVAGAGFTTNNPHIDGDASCLNGPAGSTPKVNCNIYDQKEHVWINGGPSNGKNALTAGTYFFAVLEPGGQNDSINDSGPQNLSDTNPAGGIDDTAGDAYTNREFTVAQSGKIATSLGDHATDATYVDPNGLFIQLFPYDTTSNPGGVYILAICQLSTDQATVPVTGTVAPAACKYDAFKVSDGGTVTNFGVVSGEKYYDANVNGQLDAGEVGIANWPINFTGGVSGTLTTDSGGNFSASFVADDYTFSEQLANSPWMQTGNTVDQTTSTGGANATLNGNKTYSVHVVDDSTVSGLNFGNVCVGAGGGLTLGFWSNRNGQALVGSTDLALLVSLNLRNANGTNFDPGNYAAFKSWLLSATATNMAYMLSAQLAAMELNVFNGFVNGGSLIYAPGSTSANAAGFATVNAVMAEANTSLGANGLTVAASATRTYQEVLKNALDKANNNLNFLQPDPAHCPTPVFP